MVINMSSSKLRDLSVDFSIAVVRICSDFKGRSSMVNQLEEAATAMGINIHLADYAADKADYAEHLKASLKECYKTEYWIELLGKSKIFEELMTQKLMNTCGTLKCLIEASIKSAEKSISL